MSGYKKNLDPGSVILVVDDETSSLDSFELALRSFGLKQIILCTNGKQARELLTTRPVDAVLLDLVMPGTSGEDLLAWAGDEFPKLPIIVVTGIDTVESAVNCIKAGAFDYLVKPIEENQLHVSLGRALELSSLRQENLKLKSCFMREDLEHPEAFQDFLTNSKSLFKVFRYLEAVAFSNHPILVTGETGVGKELVAKAIHKLTNPKAPFAAVNLAGLDEHLFSDTLFGHKKGAFTGAATSRQGLIEKAGQGILFLDEIGDLSPAMQIKLLRMLQEREYMPLGSDVAKPMEAMIITATHRNLEELKDQGKFREDLFYRLSTYHVHIPPLRQRPEDLVLLTEHFIEKAAYSLNRPAPRLDSKLKSLLASYSFPGNVRELKALIHNAMAKTKAGQSPFGSLKKRIAAQEHEQQGRPGFTSRPAQTVLLPDPLPTLEEMNTILVQEAMNRCQGKQVAAARMLGISQPALSKRLKKMSTDL